MNFNQNKFALLLLQITVFFMLLIQSHAQHEVTIQVSQDQPITIDFQSSSCMALGCFRPDQLQLEALKAGEDGQVSFEIVSLEGGSEKIEISLKGTGTSPSAFSFCLEDGLLYISETLEGVTIKDPIQNNGNTIGYKEFDELIVYRCQNKIIYLFNQEIVRITDLENNEFEMLGDIMIRSSSSASIFANVKFKL